MEGESWRKKGGKCQLFFYFFIALPLVSLFLNSPLFVLYRYFSSDFLSVVGLIVYITIRVAVAWTLGGDCGRAEVGAGRNGETI